MTPTVGQRAARALERHRADLVETTVDEELARRPEYWARHGPVVRTRCVEDTHFHVSFLVTALTMQEPRIFVDYTAWLIQLLGSFGMAREDVELNFRLLVDVAARKMSADEVGAVRALVEEALA